MTVTREDLLRAAYASKDDTDIHVYADWLEQHGEVLHAQVVHLQCELARTGRYDRRRAEIELELAAVFSELGTEWHDHLPALDGVEWIELERGLPSAVRCRNIAALVENADAIIAAAPFVHTVELASVESGTVPAIPWLRTLRVKGFVTADVSVEMQVVPTELDLDIGSYPDLDWISWECKGHLEALALRNNANVSNALARTLAEAEWASELKTLYFPTSRGEESGNFYEADPRIDEDGGRSLASLRKLEVLTLDRQLIDDDTLEHLVKKLENLRELSVRESWVRDFDLTKAKGASIERVDISNNAIGSAGAQNIMKSPRLRAIKELVLDTCEIDAAGLANIIKPPLWDELRILNLSRNPLGMGSARVLAEAPRPANLHTLLLADVDFDEAAANLLGKCEWLGAMTVLDLSGNPMRRGTTALRNLVPDTIRDLRFASIGMERTEAVVLSRFWPKVVHLDIGGNAITDAGLERFAATKEATMLQTLNLHDCSIGDDGLELLAQRGRAPRLRSLVLSGNAFHAPGLEALLRSGFAKQLQSLDLQDCDLDDDAVALLASMPMPPRLALLDLRRNELTEKQLLVLAESEPLRAVPAIRIGGNPFVLDPAARECLAERFGPDWYY